MVYHSHRLNRVILQIAYNPARDHVPPGSVFAEVASIPPDTGHRILGGGLELCPPGYIRFLSLATGCLACPPGKFSEGYNQSACTICPVGTFGGGLSMNGDVQPCQACRVVSQRLTGASHASCGIEKRKVTLTSPQLSPYIST